MRACVFTLPSLHESLDRRKLAQFFSDCFVPRSNETKSSARGGSVKRVCLYSHILLLPLTFDESFHNLGQKVFSLLAFTLNVPNKLNSEEIDSGLM